MRNNFKPVMLSDLWFYDNQNDCIVLFSDKDLSLNNFQLNEIESFIWKHCTGEHSNEDIAQSLFNEIEGAKPSFNEVLIDVNSYLFELKMNSLVDWESDNLLVYRFQINIAI